MFLNFLVKIFVIFQLNGFIRKIFGKEKECVLPEPSKDCSTSFPRPRILQMEKLVSDLMETGAGMGRLRNSTRDLLA